MASVKQAQRRAIESLAPYLAPLTITFSGRQRYFLDEKEVYFAGISIGVGTCADLKGIDFAVFCEEWEGLPITPPKAGDEIHVAGFVFFHYSKTEEDRRAAGRIYWRGEQEVVDAAPVGVVEALCVAYSTALKIYFRRVGKKAAYIPIAG